jgi:DNA-binding transcriptional regulator YiaG
MFDSITQGGDTCAPLTAQEVKTARILMGLTEGGLASLLRMGNSGRRQVRRWESGDVPVSGPASVAIEALMTGWRPREPASN